MGFSKLKSRYCTRSSPFNFSTFKNQKIVCNILTNMAKKNYFVEVTSNGVMRAKGFEIWSV